MIESAQKECLHCGDLTLHQRSVRHANHVLHFLVTILTCGFWVFIWALLALFPEKEKWRCSRCGSIPSTAGEWTESLAPIFFGLVMAGTLMALWLLSAYIVAMWS